MDDILDGWLAAPEITEFLAGDPRAYGAQVPWPAQSRRQQNQQDHFGSTEPSHMPENDQPMVSASTPIRSDSPSTQRTRRGHTKSRLGCINCKQRKVKCQETWPECGNCKKCGIICKYPRAFKNNQRDRIMSEMASEMSTLSRSYPLSASPTIFTSGDLQLFHHYMVEAFPIIPHYFEAVWIKDVPMLGHQYPYLMDAILALAGSHLAMHVDSPPQQLTLVHRHKAIKALEEAFTRWPPSPSETHVMLATSYLLTFQAGYMDDGCLEHILSLRGCALLTQVILQHGFIGPFEVGVKMNSTIVDATFMEFPPFNQHLACAGLISCRNVARYVEGRNAQPIEIALLVQVVQMLRSLLGSTPEENRESTTLYATAHASPPRIAVQSTWATTTPYSVELASTTRVTSPPTSPSLSTMSPPLPSPPIPSLPSARGIPIEHPLLRSPSAPRTILSLSSIPWSTITEPPSLHPEPINSFNAFMSTITILATYPHPDLLGLFSEENRVGAVVLIHVLVVRMLVSPLSAPRGWMKNPVGATVDWVGRIIGRVEGWIDDGGGGENEDEKVELAKCIEWPRTVVACMKQELERKKGLNLGDVRDILIHDAGALLEGRARRR